MTAPQTIGLVGGIAGAVIGLLGGVVGTYFSIKNTRTQAERRFLIRCALAVWVLTLALIVAPLVLVILKMFPIWLYWTIWAVYMLTVQLSLPRLNRRANELRGVFQPVQSP